MGVQFAHSATVCPIKLPNRVLYFITQFPYMYLFKDTRTTCSTSKYISSSNVKCVISDCELSYYSPPFHFSLHFTHSEEQTTSSHFK